VIGPDVTPELLELARRNAVAAGVDNVEFVGVTSKISLPPVSQQARNLSMGLANTVSTITGHSDRDTTFTVSFDAVFAVEPRESSPPPPTHPGQRHLDERHRHHLAESLDAVPSSDVATSTQSVATSPSTATPRPRRSLSHRPPVSCDATQHHRRG